MIPKSMDRRLEGAGEFRASEPLQGGVLSGSKQTLAPAVEGIYAGSREQRMWRQRKKTRGEILSAGGNPKADRDAKCVSSRCSFDVRATAAAVCG
jgi:hypothetical protein